jgi:hypothetical protein
MEVRRSQHLGKSRFLKKGGGTAHWERRKKRTCRQRKTEKTDNVSNRAGLCCVAHAIASHQSSRARRRAS